MPHWLGWLISSARGPADFPDRCNRISGQIYVVFRFGKGFAPDQYGMGKMNLEKCLSDRAPATSREARKCATVKPVRQLRRMGSDPRIRLLLEADTLRRKGKPSRNFATG